MSKTQNTDSTTRLNLSDDPTASMRKTHHLVMAEKSQTLTKGWEDLRHLFHYEPMLSGFPELKDLKIGNYEIAGKSLTAPLWISSMTGGTGQARHINQNLARAAKEFGLGIGLGSCRQLLHSDEYFEDFNLRPIVGSDICLMANFGLAQVDQLSQAGELSKLVELSKKLEVDGLFVHINPLQEFFQEEGDSWSRSPLDIIDEVLEALEGTGLSLGIKEVGQGMGPESITAILSRPISVFEFGAYGGTNFSYLEKMRSQNHEEAQEMDLRFIGHTAREMAQMINEYLKHHRGETPALIISGGIRSYLQGHYLMESVKAPSVYGMALPFLTHAAKGYGELNDYITKELQGLKMAKNFLKVRSI